MSKIIVLVACMLGLSLDAAEQFFDVTPQTLEGWRIDGADPSAVASAAQLGLPAGAQLSREFQNGAVILRLVTRPVFSGEATEWPIASVGSAALALLAKDGQGRFALVIGETKVQDLPWSIPLDKKDTAVELILAYDPALGVGLISFQGKVQVFDVPISGQAVEVWLSAGGKFPWPLDLLQVMLLTTEEETKGKLGNPTDGSAKQSSADKLQAAVEKLLAKTDANKASGIVGSGGAKATSGAAVSTLEVFTPPSVRRGRIIEAVRATVARSQSK